MQSCSTHDMCWPQQSTTANPGPKSHRALASWLFLGPTMWCRELKRHTVRVGSRCALVVESGTCQRARLERRIVKAESPNLWMRSITVGDSDRRGQRALELVSTSLSRTAGPGRPQLCVRPRPSRVGLAVCGSGIGRTTSIPSSPARQTETMLHKPLSCRANPHGACYI